MNFILRRWTLYSLYSKNKTQKDISQERLLCLSNKFLWTLDVLETILPEFLSILRTDSLHFYGWKKLTAPDVCRFCFRKRHRAVQSVTIVLNSQLILLHCSRHHWYLLNFRHACATQQIMSCRIRTRKLIFEVKKIQNTKICETLKSFHKVIIQDAVRQRNNREI